ncbi:MAG: 4Fe-4S dicluster domain-containing protein [Chloroflexota bacterium]|nr:4Fe-4S dicluster domain-containing protein [Chloroflexota bacterium]
MVIDLKRCIGCYGCVIACKEEHGTPPGIFFTRVYDEESGTFPRVKKRFIPVLCNHCQNAPCEQVCPTGATYRTAEGAVLVDARKCIGCRYCFVACPYNNRLFVKKGLLNGYFGEPTPFEEVKYRGYVEGTVVKCTFCSHRVRDGRMPACVEACLAGARVFGDLDDSESEVSRLVLERNGYQPQAELGTDPSVYYLD